MNVVESFFNSSIDITNNKNDCIMSSDLRYYINQNRPYDNRISHSIISNYLKEKEIPKKVRAGSMYYFGIKWKPSLDDDIEYY
jgi:hypothetical protein